MYSPTRREEKLGKFSSDKKIYFVLNLLVVHGSLQDKEKLFVQGKFSSMEAGLYKSFSVCKFMKIFLYSCTRHSA